jgi:AcrR family transcriptional regulator
VTRADPGARAAKAPDGRSFCPRVRARPKLARGWIVVDFAGGKTLVYQSDNIFERRRRILREARRMIAKTGLAGFSVRELCARSGIAQKTLYNAFGSKENVIALAIWQYLEEFASRTTYKFDGATLEGRLEVLIKVHSRNVQVRSYTTAIMTVYNTPTASKAIRKAIRDIAEADLRLFAERLDQDKAFAPDVTAAAFIHLSTTATYAVLMDWCLGDIADDDLVDRIAEVFLIVVLGTTKGKINTEARSWLQDVRGRRPSWLALRRLTEVSPLQSMELTRDQDVRPKRRRTPPQTAD